MNIWEFLESGGNVMDLPGSMVRDVLAWQNPLDQVLSPFSGENRSSGRDVLEKWGALDDNEEGLDWGDVAWFGLELATDPTNLIPAGLIGKTLKGAKLAKAHNVGVAAKEALLAAKPRYSLAPLIKGVDKYKSRYDVVEAVSRGELNLDDATYFLDEIRDNDMYGPRAAILPDDGSSLHQFEVDEDGFWDRSNHRPGELNRKIIDPQGNLAGSVSYRFPNDEILEIEGIVGAKDRLQNSDISRNSPLSNSIGSEGLMDLLEDIAKENPSLVKVFGSRIGGARSARPGDVFTEIDRLLRHRRPKKKPVPRIGVILPGLLGAASGVRAAKALASRDTEE